MLNRLLHRWTRPEGRREAPRRGRLRLEALEPRDVPATALVNVAATGALPDVTDATVLGMSNDGTKVIFSSAATNLVTGQVDTAGTQDLFWRDLATGTTKLVTAQAGSNGLKATGQFAGEAALSGDGTKVAFVDFSNASLLQTGFLAANDKATGADSPDLFVWDPANPANTKLVSITFATGKATGLTVNDYAANATSEFSGKMHPVIDTSGNRVAYQTTFAADVLDGTSGGDGGNNTYDIFVADVTALEAGTFATANKLVDTQFQVSPGTAQGITTTNVIGDFSISGDGRFVAYASKYDAQFVDKSVIATGDQPTGGTFDIFVRDTTVATTSDPATAPNNRLVTRDQANPANAAGKTAGVNSDGVQIARQTLGTVSTLVYHSNATNLVANFNGSGVGEHIYRSVFDFANPTAVTANTQLVDQATTAATTGGNGAVGGYSVSGDGTKVAFVSSATNLVSGLTDANAAPDVFVRDFAANKTVAITVTPGGTLTGNGASTNAKISDNGNVVAFQSDATNLVAGLSDTNGAPDVFERDLTTSRTSIASLVPGTRLSGNAASTNPFVGVASDGTVRVAFTSKATDLVSGLTVNSTNGAAFVTTLPPGGVVLLGLSKEVAISGPATGQAQTFKFDAAGNLAAVDNGFTPFTGFTGDVRAATGDIDGDGKEDTVYGIGPGGGSMIRVVTSTGVDVSTQVYEAGFTGGVFLAVGDMDGDGKAEIVVSPDVGGGGRVVVFRLQGGQLVRVADFFGIDDPSFRGGARVALGDVNGDGTLDLIVAAGFGGGPRIALFDGKSVLSNGSAPTKLVGDFFVFEQTLRNGVFVTSGDFDGDGKWDVAFGGGPGGGPRVFILSGPNILSNSNPASTAPLANFFAGDPSQRGGIRLAAKDIDGDNLADLVVGSGEGFPAQVRTYLGKNVITSANGQEPTVQQTFTPFGGPVSAAGIYVG